MVEKLKKGLFISLEGTDGSGKSTQIAVLEEFLREREIPYVLTREPGGCAISEDIREILLDNKNEGMNAYTEALLYAAARVQHIDEVLLPALKQGRVVLCDRYIDSSIAYQAFGRRLGTSFVWEINQYALDHCMPDETLYFDCPPAVAQQRMQHADREADRLERAGDAFFERVYEGFDYLAKEHASRITRIDASRSRQQVSKDMLRVVGAVLQKREEQ